MFYTIEIVKKLVFLDKSPPTVIAQMRIYLSVFADSTILFGHKRIFHFSYE